MAWSSQHVIGAEIEKHSRAVARRLLALGSDVSALPQSVVCKSPAFTAQVSSWSSCQTNATEQKDRQQRINKQ